MPHSPGPRRLTPGLASAAALLALACAAPAAARERGAGGDLDAFMLQVLARRDENWKKLQQYVLDEHERAEILAPGRVRLYGLSRDYTWYIRDGVFVRSPVRFDGVTLDEAERREYERKWLADEQARERRRKDGAETLPAAEAGDVEGLVSLAREPRFVSAAYFLRFKFEAGRYAFVGREQYEGREVYRIEYYPTRLFHSDHEASRQRSGSDQVPASRPDEYRDREQEIEDRLTRQMNKVALITLWVEPSAHQIVKYVFDNVGFDFLPGRWFARVDEVTVSMRMREAFPGVWLPGGIDGQAGLTLASGTYAVRYSTEYSKYRQADVEVKIR